MQRIHLLIWLLTLSLAGAHLGSTLFGTESCCRGSTASENSCQIEIAADVPDQASGQSPCCPAPADTTPAGPSDDTRDHEPDHPCKCPSQCCVAGKAPVTLVSFHAPAKPAGHAPRVAAEWREPLPNPTLDRLKRPPRTLATA